MNPVIQRVEASSRRPLDRPVQFALEGSNLIKGVVGPHGHAPVPPSPTNMDEAGALRSDGLCCPADHRYRMAPSDALPAQRDFPFGGYTRWLLPGRRPGAGVGLSSSRHHPPNVPRPLRRGVLRRCASRCFTPSVAFALVFRARLPLGPFRVGLTPRQTSRTAADRSVATSKRLPTLGFDVRRFPLPSPACYQAPWRLPGRDFHPLVVTSLRATRSCQAKPPPSVARALWTRSTPPIPPRSYSLRLPHQGLDEVATADP